MPRAAKLDGSVATSEWSVVSTASGPTGGGNRTSIRSRGSSAGTNENAPSRNTADGSTNSSSSVSTEYPKPSAGTTR